MKEVVRTPDAFVSEPFASALGGIAACAVANLTCPVPMWEDANESYLSFRSVSKVVLVVF